MLLLLLLHYYSATCDRRAVNHLCCPRRCTRAVITTGSELSLHKSTCDCAFGVARRSCGPFFLHVFHLPLNQIASCFVVLIQHCASHLSSCPCCAAHRRSPNHHVFHCVSYQEKWLRQTHQDVNLRCFSWSPCCEGPEFETGRSLKL